MDPDWLPALITLVAEDLREMMAAAELLGLALMAVVFAAVGIRQRDRSDLMIAALLAFALVAALALNRSPAGPVLVVIGVLELLTVLLAAVFLMDAFSAPLPLVRRIPVLRRRAQWRFDGALHRELVRFRALSDAPASPLEIRAIGHGMRRLRAPDNAWARLRDGYAAALGAQADYIERGDRDLSWEAAFNTELEQLAERCAALRTAYEDPART